MGILPIPAKVFFDDFSFDALEYVITRNSSIIGTFSGLINKDEDGNYIGFLSDCNIQSGDILSSGNKTYIISNIDFDYYNNKPEMLKAYY